MRCSHRRAALVGVVAAAAVALGGCTGSQGGGSTSGGGTTPAARGGASGSASSGPSRTVASDPRADVPRVSPAKLSGISYAKASTDRVRLFAPVAKAAGGLATQESVTTVRVGSRDAGAVAVYTLKAGRPRSTTFQDQYVVQLVNAVTRSSSEPRFVKVGSQVMALSTGQKAVAGWVSGDRVVLVIRQGGRPDLAALAAAVNATPVKG